MENEFKDRLLKAIEESGISKADLSKLSGIRRCDISNYTNGKYLPKQDKVYLLAKALNVDPGWMITGVEPKTSREEQAIVNAYRIADEGTKSAVRKLLDVPEPKKEDRHVG